MCPTINFLATQTETLRRFTLCLLHPLAVSPLSSRCFSPILSLFLPHPHDASPPSSRCFPGLLCSCSPQYFLKVKERKVRKKQGRHGSPGPFRGLLSLPGSLPVPPLPPPCPSLSAAAVAVGSPLRPHSVPTTSPLRPHFHPYRANGKKLSRQTVVPSGMFRLAVFHRTCRDTPTPPPKKKLLPLPSRLGKVVALKYINAHQEGHYCQPEHGDEMVECGDMSLSSDLQSKYQ